MRSAPPSIARRRASEAFSTFPHTSPTTVLIWARATFISLIISSWQSAVSFHQNVFCAPRVGAFAAWDRIRGVATGEDPQREAFKGSRSHPSVLLLRGAVLAAEMLEEAVAPGSGNPLRLEVVRGLARDLTEELEFLLVLPADELTAIEGALKTADV